MPSAGRRGPSGTLAEVLAEHDEAILRAFVRDDGRRSRTARLREQLAAQTRRGLGPPGVLRLGRLRASGSTTLLAGIDELLPVPRGDPDAPVSGRVFKIERTPAGERVAYVRLFAGTLRPRQRVRVGGGEEAKPTSIKVFAPAGAPRRDVAHGRGDGGGPRARRRSGRRRHRRAAAGRGGDGAVPASGARGRRVRRCGPRSSGSLRAALAQLAEQDPLIDVRQDDHRHEIAVSLYGEVQKEVIGATLERDYGIAADFRETTTVCIERPARVGEAEEVIRAKTHTNITGRSSPLSTNPFLATLALRIEPAPFGSGIEFRSDVEARYVPLYLFKTVDDVRRPRWSATSREALSEGLAGWQVTDCRVTMTDCGYASPVTSAGRLPAADAARADDRARSCRDLGVRAARGPRARDAVVDRARRARRSLGRLGGRVTGQFSANGVTKVERGAAGRARADAPAPAARPVDGGGDPRDPARRLPAGRRRQPAAPRALDTESPRPRRLAGVTGKAGMMIRASGRRFDDVFPGRPQCGGRAGSLV